MYKKWVSVDNASLALKVVFASASGCRGSIDIAANWVADVGEGKIVEGELPGEWQAGTATFAIAVLCGYGVGWMSRIFIFTLSPWGLDGCPGYSSSLGICLFAVNVGFRFAQPQPTPSVGWC